MSTKLQLRYDTYDNWYTTNCILALGEVGIDITNWKVKIGDGMTPWNDLEPFLNPLNANHHDLNESIINDDDDEIVIWDNSEGQYLKQNRFNFLKNDSVKFLLSINDAETLNNTYNGQIIFIKSVNTFYIYVANQSLSVDHKFILTTTNVDDRFIAIGGELINNNLDISGSYLINGVKVVGNRLQEITDMVMNTTETPNVTYGSNEINMLNHLKSDITLLSLKLNTILDRLREHGLIEH